MAASAGNDPERIDALLDIGNRLPPVTEPSPQSADAMAVAQIVNDVEVGDDQLGVEDELRALARTIAMVEVRPPLVIGLMGGWGSGKSFAVHLIQKELGYIRAQPSGRAAQVADGLGVEVVEYVGHPYTVFFNAWTFAKSDLWASLMQEIFTQLETQVSLEDQLSRLDLDPEQGGPLWAEVFSAQRVRFHHALERFAKNHPDKADAIRQIAAHQNIDKLWEALSDEEEQKKIVALEKERIALEDQVAAKTKEFERLQEQRQQHLERSLKEVEQRHEKHYGDLIQLLAQGSKKFLGKDLDPHTEEDLHEAITDLKTVKNQFLQLGALLRHALATWPRWLVLLLVVFAAFQFVDYKFIDNWLDELVKGALATLAPIFGAILHFWREKRTVIHNALAELEKLGGSLDSFKKIQAANEKRIQEEKAAVIARYDLDAKEHVSHTAELCKKSRNDLREIQQKLEEKQLEFDRLAERVGVRRFTSLRNFLRTRLESGDYSSKLGLIHQVQNDLSDLSEALLNENLRGKDGIFPRGEPRIVIFIDDLDRCPPNKVVDMLEAVQLLCKTQLFVVVLAVDMRYITRALEKEYAGILDPNNRPSGLDYVEKIIQIPYQMHLHSGDRLVNLLGRDVAEAELKRRDASERAKDPVAAQRSETTPAPAPAASASERVAEAEQASPPQEAPVTPQSFEPELTRVASAEPTRGAPKLLFEDTRQLPGMPGGLLQELLSGKATLSLDFASSARDTFSLGDTAPAAPEPEAPPMDVVAAEPPAQPVLDRGVFLPTRKIQMTTLERKLLAEMCASCFLTPRSTKRMGNVFRLLKVVLLTARKEWDEPTTRLMIVLLVLAEYHVPAMSRLFRNQRPGQEGRGRILGEWLNSEDLPGAEILGEELCKKKLSDFDRNMVQLIRSFSFLDVGASVEPPRAEAS